MLDIHLFRIKKWTVEKSAKTSNDTALMQKNIQERKSCIQSNILRKKTHCFTSILRVVNNYNRTALMPPSYAHSSHRSHTGTIKCWRQDQDFVKFLQQDSTHCSLRLSNWDRTRLSELQLPYTTTNDPLYLCTLDCHPTLTYQHAAIQSDINSGLGVLDYEVVV